MIRINLRPSVRPDIVTALDMVNAKAISGPNWLMARTKKRAVGRRHKPGKDYIAMKEAQRKREEELANEPEITDVAN